MNKSRTIAYNMNDTPFERLKAIMRRLRAPGGCPWDREQTFESLKTYLLEETYEVIEAIDKKDHDQLREELGDLLLQIVFQSQIATEENLFTIDDVAEHISNKLIRRHPHVFGSAQASTADEVLRNWEFLKKEEREKRGGGSILQGIPKALPALTKARRIGEKVSRVGFDWESPRDVIPKIREELTELQQALEEGKKEAIESEMGDLLFSISNLSRHLGIDPESALQGANHKFISRFKYIENSLKKERTDLEDASPKEMEKLWEESKEAGIPISEDSKT